MVYEIFSLTELLEVNVESQPIEIGTCTVEESETLDKLLRLGITSQSSSTWEVAADPACGPKQSTSNVLSASPTSPKSSFMDTLPGDVDHKMVVHVIISTTETVKPHSSPPPEVPSSLIPLPHLTVKK